MVAHPLRIGILGAARITELSLVGPAHATGARLVAVAARDRSRAEAFARQHGVERVAGSYAELLADPELEVVYNPLANALHGPWNRAAVTAGKHVLTEKPSASDAAEAREVRDAERKAAREAAEAARVAEAARLAAEEATRAAERVARDAEDAAREVALEAERKAARDARYAARKARR